MRRILIIVAAALLAVLLIAPAAQAMKRYGYFQDLSVSASSRIFLTVLYKDNHGNGRFTPRAAVSYRLQAGVRCATGDFGDLHISGNKFGKYSYFVAPLRNGLFSHRFENQFEQPELSPLKGDLKGNVLTRRKKGSHVVRTPRINGSFHVEDWDPAPGVTDCMSTGWYSATPCKRWISPRAPKYDRWKQRKLPVCKQTW